MGKTVIAGLDIGTAAIRLTVGEVLTPAGGVSSAPRLLAQVKKESRGLRRGYIINFEETLSNLKETVKEAERQAKQKIKSAFLGIGGTTLEAKVSDGQIMVSSANLTINENEVKRAMEASAEHLTKVANRNVLHTIPLAFKVDGQKVLTQPVGMTGKKLEVRTLFVQCLTQHLNDLVRATTLAGLEVEDIIASPLAASFAALTPRQKMAGCVLINIGSQTTSIAVFEEDILIHLQIFPIGSNDVTNDIALGLRVPLEEAEVIKLSGSETPQMRKKLDEIVEARLSDIFELVEGSLKKIGRAGLLPAGAIIVGGGASIQNIEKMAKEILRLPARVFDPNAIPQLKNQLRDASWVVSYGLYLFGLGAVSEESFGIKVVKATGGIFWRWLKEFWP